MTDIQTRSKLFGLLMEAGTGFNNWIPFLDEYARVYELRYATILVYNAVDYSFKYFLEGGTPLSADAINDYVGYYKDQDVFNTFVKENFRDEHKHQVYVTQDTISEEEYLNSAYYKEWCVPNDLKGAAASLIFEDKQWIAIFIMTRRVHQPMFDKEYAQNEFGPYIPLIEIALKNGLQAAENQSDQSRARVVINAYRLPVAIYNEFGELWVMNEAMETLIQKNMPFKNNMERIELQDQHANFGLQRAVFEAVGFLNHKSYGRIDITYDIEEADVRFAFELTGTQEDAESDVKSVMVYAISISTLEQINPDVLRDVFGLTKTEAKVCCKLLQGLGAKSIAADRGVTEHTIRDQIKQIYRKCGCNSHAALANLIGSLPNFQP